ncbi:MAG: TatD family hydrolase [Candidatus Komeilibacteria bacterium]
MLIDAHAHLDFEAFDEDREEVIKKCQDQQVKVINVGSQLATSKLAVSLAQKYEGLFATVGLHPIHVYDEEFKIEDYQELINNNKNIVGIGECGYDYYYLKEKERSFAEVKEKQQKVFESHIKLAKDNDLPLMLHGRNGETQKTANIDIIQTLVDNDCHQGLIHCFDGTKEEADSYIQQGFYIGITGIVTFKKKSEELQELVAELPMDKIILNTDSPYLTPEPHRGKRNVPYYVEFIAQKVAELKRMSYDEVVRQNALNCKNLFKI